MTEDVRDIWTFRISALYFIQEVLSLEHDGNSKLITLRRKGESICAQKERKKHIIEQSQSELEEEWARVLQTAREMKNQIEHEDSLSKELKSYQDQLECTQAWIRKLKVTLQSMDKASPAEEITTQAQVLEELNISIPYFVFLTFVFCLQYTKNGYPRSMYETEVYRNVKFNSKELNIYRCLYFFKMQTVMVLGPEGDSKLAALKYTGECVCTCEGLKEDTRQSIQQTQGDLEHEWREVLDFAQNLRNKAEIQVALDKKLQDFNSQEEIFRTWVIELQKQFESLDKDAPLQEIIDTSQVMYS